VRDIDEEWGKVLPDVLPTATHENRISKVPRLSRGSPICIIWPYQRRAQHMGQYRHETGCSICISSRLEAFDVW